MINKERKSDNIKSGSNNYLIGTLNIWICSGLKPSGHLTLTLRYIQGYLYKGIPILYTVFNLMELYDMFIDTLTVYL